MEKLTDERLEGHEIYLQINPGREVFLIVRKDYEALIAEVREGRRVVEIKEWGGTHIYNCPGCDKEFDAEGTMNGELSKHCCHCGVKLTWKD